MRKELISILTAALLLCSGCTAEKKDAEAASLASYEGYYKAVADNSRFQKGSLYYSISAEMSELPDGTHRYYVFLDNPQVAMYDIIMMAVENDTALADAKKMFPSIGIFDNTNYSMIPSQVYSDGGYVKGLVMSGETADPSINLKIIVEWNDQSNSKVYREFIAMTVSMDGVSYPDGTEEATSIQ
jgi:hypothetical protein